MLGVHPQVFSTPELNVFAAGHVGELFDMADANEARVLHGLARTCAFLHDGTVGEGAVDAGLQWLRRNECWSTGALFRRLVDTVAPSVLADKSPLYCIMPTALDRLRVAEPEARLLHLVRDPAASIPSLARLFGPSVAEPLVAAAGAWSQWNLHISQFLATWPPAQTRRVRAEELVDGGPSHDALRAACGWLGIDDGDGSLDAMHHPERWLFAQSAPSPAGGDLSFFEHPALRTVRSAPELRQLALPKALERGVALLAEHFGYEESGGCHD